jgi:outer membrane protein TolC
MVATARPAYPQAWQPRVATDSTLRSLIDEAIQRNPGLAQRQAVAQAATMRIRPAGTIADPVLSLGVMDLNLPNFRRSDFSEIDAEVRQEFPWPGTLRFRSGVARAGADMARAEVGARRREITTAVAEVYYRLRYLATALGILDRQRRLLSAGWDLSNTRYATGAAPQSDPLLARVARDRLDAEDAALRGDYDAAWATLNALRVRPSSDTTGVRPFDLADLRAHIAPLPPVDSLVVLAVSNHPTVAARRAVVAQAGTTIRLERLGALPDFSFAVRYGYRGTVGGVPLPDFLSAFVGVRLPIWAGRKQYRLADAARADSAGAESALREEEARLTQEVSEIAARATAAQRRLALLLDGVLPAARAAVESGQRSYQVGKAEFLTVLTAEDALFRAEIEAASVAAEHQTHLVMLAELTAEENQP